MNLKTSLIVLAGAAVTATAQTQTDLSAAYEAAARADAADRASLLQSGNDFAPEAFGRIQFRYQATFIDDDAADDDVAIGFQNRRMRMGLKGDIADGVSYYIQGDFGGSDGVFDLKDAYADFEVGENGVLRVGQFKPFLVKEQYISSGRQLAVDRSAANSAFNVDRVQGIEYMWESDAFRVAAGFNDGANTDNTSYTSAAEADWAVYARAEFKFGGTWAATRQFTSWRGSEFTNVLGAGIHYQSGGETIGTVDTDLLLATVDYQIAANGWNAYVAGLYSSADPSMGDDVDLFGVVAQGGLFLSDQFEIFGRYDGVFGDDEDFAEDTFSVATVGFNYYMTPRSHAVKFTVDGQYAFDAINGSPVMPSNGLAFISSGEDGQFALRAQMTINF